LTLLTGPVSTAVCLLMIRWGLAVPAHLLRRVSPAELLARGRDEVTGYGGEIIANEEDDL
jgi:hypothetical protein